MLAERVKTLRAERGWTQTQLAQKAGVSQQLITKIERGEVLESRKLPKIAAAFGLTVEQFLVGDARRPVATQTAWPFARLQPADLVALPPHQIADIEELIEDRIARFRARNGPRRRRKSHVA